MSNLPSTLKKFETEEQPSIYIDAIFNRQEQSIINKARKQHNLGMHKYAQQCLDFALYVLVFSLEGGALHVTTPDGKKKIKHIQIPDLDLGEPPHTLAPRSSLKVGQLVIPPLLHLEYIGRFAFPEEDSLPPEHPDAPELLIQRTEYEKVLATILAKTLIIWISSLECLHAPGNRIRGHNPLNGRYYNDFSFMA